MEYHDLDEAKMAVKRNKVWGLIYFSGNYTASLVERIMFKEETDDTSITLSEVNVWQDMSSTYKKKKLIAYIIT